MASLIKSKTTKGTTYFIQLSPGEHSGRPKISLGKCNKRNGETAKVHIESLISGRNTGSVISPQTQEWIARLTPSVRQRLEYLELIEPLANCSIKIAEWVSQYIKRRPDVKEATRRKWRDVERKLNAFFRNDCLEDVTVQQAKAFRVYLQNTVGLSENSIRRQIGIARQFFNDAMDADVIRRNPFRGQPVSVRANESKFYFVTPQQAQSVLDACPDIQWRLIFGLARFGGLRCPSELLRLKWQDVDFEHLRFTIHSSKTEHHADGGIRTVPMFPELQPLFQDAFDQAKPGDVYCITRYRSKGTNLRTQLTKIVRRAGLEPWPKLFQNCRSSRETELFKLTNGNVKAVCKWIGNSPAVAMQHYAQVTEADLRGAAELAVLGDGKNMVQNQVHVVQNQVQNTAANHCTESQDGESESTQKPRYCDDIQENAIACDSMQDVSPSCQMGVTGLEPVTSRV